MKNYFYFLLIPLFMMISCSGGGLGIIEPEHVEYQDSLLEFKLDKYYDSKSLLYEGGGSLSIKTIIALSAGLKDFEILERGKKPNYKLNIQSMSSIDGDSIGSDFFLKSIVPKLQKSFDFDFWPIELPKKVAYFTIVNPAQLAEHRVRGDVELGFQTDSGPSGVTLDVRGLTQFANIFGSHFEVYVGNELEKLDYNHVLKFYYGMTIEEASEHYRSEYGIQVDIQYEAKTNYILEHH